MTSRLFDVKCDVFCDVIAYELLAEHESHFAACFHPEHEVGSVLNRQIRVVPVVVARGEDVRRLTCVSVHLHV